MVDKRLGWTRAQKKRRTVKKKKVRGKNMGHSQQCVGERLDRDMKKASEQRARSKNTGHS